MLRLTQCAAVRSGKRNWSRYECWKSAKADRASTSFMITMCSSMLTSSSSRSCRKVRLTWGTLSPSASAISSWVNGIRNEHSSAKPITCSRVSSSRRKWATRSSADLRPTSIKCSAYIAASQAKDQNTAAASLGCLSKRPSNRENGTGARTQSLSAVIEYSARSEKALGNPMKSPGNAMLSIWRRPSWSIRQRIETPSIKINKVSYFRPSVMISRLRRITRVADCRSSRIAISSGVSAPHRLSLRVSGLATRGSAIIGRGGMSAPIIGGTLRGLNTLGRRQGEVKRPLVLGMVVAPPHGATISIVRAGIVVVRKWH